jgi:hypothetical protein
MAMCEAHRDALLDGIGLVKATLDGDNEALRAILDLGDNRAQAAALARLAGGLVMMEHPDNPEAVLGPLRELYGAS